MSDSPEQKQDSSLKPEDLDVECLTAVEELEALKEKIKILVVEKQRLELAQWETKF
jgi:hypothetical protein